MNCPFCNKQVITNQIGWINRGGYTDLECGSSPDHFFKYRSEQYFYLIIKKIPYRYTLKRSEILASITVSSIIIDLDNIKPPLTTFLVNPNFTCYQAKDILDRYIKLQAFS